MKLNTNCEKYESSFHKTEDGWIECVIHPKLGVLYPINLFYKNLVQALSTLFLAPTNKEGFNIGSRSTSTAVPNCYSIPSASRWWRFIQVLLGGGGSCKTMLIALGLS